MSPEPLFIDDRRLAWYARATAEDDDLPCWSTAAPAPDVSMDEALAGMLERLPDLEAAGTLARRSMTPGDPWLDERALSHRGVLRLEETDAHRIVLTGSDGGELAFWWSATPQRHLILRECWAVADGFADRSRDHSIRDRFELFFFEELLDSGIFHTDVYALHGVGTRPEHLARHGAVVSPARRVRILHRLHHVCFPVRDLHGVVLCFGAPLAIWPADAAVEAGATAAVKAFVVAARWSEAQRCLERDTDVLFAPSALAEVETAMDEHPPMSPWPLGDPRELLAAAHRLGVLGAERYAQMHGLPSQVDSGAGYPPLDAALGQLHLLSGAGSRQTIEAFEQLLPAIDSRLYPAQKGELFRNVAYAYEALGDSERTIALLEAAAAVRPPDRDPIGCGVARFNLAAMLMRHGGYYREERARAAADLYRAAVEHLDPRHLDDPLLCALSPRTPAQVADLRWQAKLGLAEAIVHGSARLSAARWREADALISALEQQPAFAQRACLLAGDLALGGEEIDPDARRRAAEAAWKRGLEHGDNAPEATRTRAQLQLRLAGELLREEAFGYAKRLEEADRLVTGALGALSEESQPDVWGFAKLMRAQLLEKRHPPAWETEAAACARDAFRIGEVLPEPALAAQAMATLATFEPDEQRRLEAHARAADALAAAGLASQSVRELQAIAEAHFATGRWPEGLKAFEAAIEALEQSSAGGWADRVLAASARESAMFPAAALCALRSGAFAQGVVLLERGRARFLKRYRTGSVDRPELEDLLAAVPPGGALVAPFVTDAGAAAFVTPAGARQVSAEDVVELHFDRRTAMGTTRGLGLAWWIGAYLDFLNHGDFERWEAAIEEACEGVWNRVMGPVAARLDALGLERSAQVLCAPPNMLASLPLQAARAPDGCRPFAERFLFSVTPSLGLSRAAASTQAAARQRVVAAIDPTGELPFSCYEDQALRTHAVGFELVALLGAQATAASFLSECDRPAYLHMATHGVNDLRNPHFSSLRMRDGAIGAFAFLDPPADLAGTRLVVLSACETGVSTGLRLVAGNTMTLGGEEHVGLPAAILAAGARHVVSTLWPVEDYPTALFIEELWRRILASADDVPGGVASARDTLRALTAGQARYDVARRRAEQPAPALDEWLGAIDQRLAEGYADDDRPFDHPIHWAGFVLTSCGAAQS